MWRLCFIEAAGVLGLAGCLTALWSTPAMAGYSPEMHPTAETAVEDADSLLVTTPSPQVAVVGSAVGLHLGGFIRIEPGMNRHLVQGRGSKPDAPVLQELRLTAAAPVDTDLAAESYLIDGQALYLGLGEEFDEQNDWFSRYQIVTFRNKAGAVEIIDTFELGYTYSTGVFIVDLDGDGLLEIVCPSTSGVSYAGQIDIRTITPAGSLAPFAGTEEMSVLDAAYANCELHDNDQNGRWEIETYSSWNFQGIDTFFLQPVWEYSTERANWFDLQGRFPEQYAAYLKFYGAFAGHVKEYQTAPERYPADASPLNVPACQIDGKWYPVTGFNADTAARLYRYASGWDIRLVDDDHSN